MIVLIDNYDSFTYNIFQVISDLTNEEIRVIRNDEIDLKGLRELNPSKLIISPGPGRPEEAGVSIEAIIAFGVRFPYWESVWAIRPWPMPLAAGLFLPKELFTVRQNR
jgi:anthranilate synthase/phosphoribosyltransferase